MMGLEAKINQDMEWTTKSFENVIKLFKAYDKMHKDLHEILRAHQDEIKELKQRVEKLEFPNRQI